MRAVIMAGGKGTRLAGIAGDIPKPLMNIDGKPVLERQIESLLSSHITDITLIVGNLGDRIKEYFGNGEKWGVNISYITEETPMGTAGALSLIKETCREQFLLLFGDIMLDINFERFLDYHRKKNSEVTLFVHPNSHPFDSDLVVSDESGKIIGWDSKKNIRNYDYKNMVNAGIYVLTEAIFNYIPKNTKSDLESNVIIPMINEGRAVYAYCSSEYAKDMGTPERLYSVARDVEKGVSKARNLRNKQKCIFLDRDGTINELAGFLKSPEDLKLIDGAARAISVINRSPYLCIVVTNQPVIARGECTSEGLERIHKRMETLLGKEGAYLDHIFYCPHHPDIGYEGEVKELKFDCDCRKPKIGMLLQAQKIFNIDLEQSYFIGDTSADLQTGKNANMKTILVQTGEGGRDGKYHAVPDEICSNLLTAVNLILQGEKR